MLPHCSAARSVVACALLIATTAGTRAASTAQELIRQEEVRAEVAAAMKLYRTPTEDGNVANDNLVRAVHRLAQVGPEAVPFLANELSQKIPPTYLFSAYALGLIGGDEAEQALRDSVASSEQMAGQWAELTKAWACWALTLAGRADALTLMNEGQHKAAHAGMHANLSVLEAGALLIGREGTPLLLQQLESYDDENDPQYVERSTVIKALGRVADPAALPALVKLLAEGAPMLRREVAPALGGFDSPAAIDALLVALHDDDLLVRRGAALGLKVALPVGRLDPVLARLPLEESAVMRGMLYEIIARAGGEPETDTLLAHWGHGEDPLDRGQLVAMLPYLDVEKSRPTLRLALDDPDASVRIGAARVAAASPDPQARTWLIESVQSPFWTLAQASIEFLGALRDPRAGEPLAHRMIDLELSGVVTDPRQRLRVEKLGDALLALRDVSRLEDLQQAASRQKDGTLVLYLERLIARFETIRSLGGKHKRWIEALESPDADTRMLAYDFLGRYGKAQASEPLVATFGRVEPVEGVEILRALARADSSRARELIARVLTAPEFDPIALSALRDMAAWTARRIGPEMYPVLLAGVERRDGRDTVPLVYLAVLGGPQAVPLLDRYRAVRLRYIKWTRATEMDRLDWIRRQLTHGRPLDEVDVPPADLTF